MTQKHWHLFIFFVFDTGYLAFCRNRELVILKNHMFLYRYFLILKLVPNFCLIVMGHFIAVCERTCYKDPETEKLWDVIFPPKKFKIRKTNKQKISQNDQFYIYPKFQVPSIKTKTMNEGERFGVTLRPQCIYTYSKSLSSQYLVCELFSSKIVLCLNARIIHVIAHAGCTFHSYLSQLNVTCSSGE